MKEQIDVLVELVEKSTCMVAFTGAGISTESGLPDFRSPGGVWSRFRPVTFQEFQASDRGRMDYWDRYLEFYPPFTQVQPNPAHLALAELEKQGILKAIITQNIDRLHHAAGNAEEKVIELHGRIDQTICLDCGLTLNTGIIIDRVKSGERAPTCDQCGGWLKPATISFGQNLPAQELEKAARWASSADLFLAIGSSLTVHPAAALPGLALEHNAHLVILNATATSYDSHAHLVITGQAGPVLAAVIERFGWSVRPN